MIELFFQLLIAHALCDFVLQGDSMALGKSRYTNSGQIDWYYWLTAHALIHAGAVYLILGFWYAVAELVLHWIVDLVKCEGWTSIHTDQFAHIMCKVYYVVYFVLIADIGTLNL